MRPCATGAVGIFALLLSLALALGAPASLGCGPRGQRLSVLFSGPLTVTPGAEVRYRGVQIGEVERVSLHQPAPDRPARVELGLWIDGTSITLREGDLFEVAVDGLLGAEYVRVTPGEDPSPPLPPGATVTGVPPFVTRVRDTAADALGVLGDLAQQKSEAVLEALAGRADEDASGEAPGGDPRDEDATVDAGPVDGEAGPPGR